MKKLFMLFVLVFILGGCEGKTGIKKESFLSRVDKEDKRLDNSLYKKTSYLFDDRKLRTIKIRIKSKLMKDIVMDRFTTKNGREYALTDSFSFDGELLPFVGIRTRGGTSSKNVKRQLKISFDCKDAYTNAMKGQHINRPKLKSRRFHGAKKINLRISQNDPTMIREKLASLAFQKLGVPAPRVGFAKVYINDEYWGVYLIVEQIDDVFLKSRFGEESGNLYKGRGGAARFDSSHVQRGFDLKNDSKNRKWRPLANLFKKLATYTNKNGIRSLVNVHNILGYYAAASLVGHWDSYSALGNNDYFYQHSDSLFRIICWDTDNTFGSGNGWGFPVLNSSVYKMDSKMTHFIISRNPNYRVLFGKLLGYPEWKKLYSTKVKYLLDSYFNKKNMFSLIKLIVRCMIGKLYLLQLLIVPGNRDFIDNQKIGKVKGLALIMVV